MEVGTKMMIQQVHEHLRHFGKEALYKAGMEFGFFDIVHQIEFENKEDQYQDTPNTEVGEGNNEDNNEDEDKSEEDEDVEDEESDYESKVVATTRSG